MIDDNPIEDSEGEDSDASGKKRKKSDEEESDDDRLEEDDYDLLEENLGVKVERRVSPGTFLTFKTGACTFTVTREFENFICVKKFYFQGVS